MKDILWKEGHEPQSASESYDYVTETLMRRLEQRYKLFDRKVQS